MTKAGQWDQLAAEIPDDLLHEFAAIGRHDEIAGIIETRFGWVSDTISDSASADMGEHACGPHRRYPGSKRRSKRLTLSSRQ